MRIIMISALVPFPPDSGARIRVLECIRALSKSNQITFIGFKVGAYDAPQMPNVQFVCIDKKYPPKWMTLTKSLLSSKPYEWTKFWDPSLKHAINEKLRNEVYDVIWIHLPFMSTYLDGHDLSKYLVVMDEHNNFILFLNVARNFLNSPESLMHQGFPGSCMRNNRESLIFLALEPLTI